MAMSDTSRVVAQPVSAPPPAAEAPWRSGLRGARAHLVPGLVLQAASLALVLAYYHAAPVGAALSALMEFKRQSGFAFGIASTAIFGGLLPFLYLRWLANRTGHRSYDWDQGIGLTAFWAYKGFEIELFYRLEARFIGSGHDLGIIARKVVFDQFIYCPAFAVPVTVAAYYLAADHFRGSAFLADVRAPHWYGRRVLPVLVSNLAVWVPAVAIIYALPTPLQLPLQNLVLCFFTLLIAHQTAPASEA
jgi:hypothetical protein